jgi:hypothetical protein
MTKHLLIALVALFVAAPSAAQAETSWPRYPATGQASTKPGLKKVEAPKQEESQGGEEEQEEEVSVEGLIVEE